MPLIPNDPRTTLMSRWFYSSGGRQNGPLTVDEIKQHAARGLLKESDWVWLEGDGRANGTPANAVIDFAHLGALPTSLPDWLHDIAALEKRTSSPPAQVVHAAPDWLDDLRLWYGWEIGVEPVAAPAPIEAPPLPASPPPSAPVPPPAPVAILVPPTLPPKAIPVGPRFAQPSPAPTPSLILVARPASPPRVTRWQAPPRGRGPQNDPDKLAETALAQTGFDPRTGQIVDPARFETWKQQTAASPSAPGAPTASIMEVFRAARLAIERWVDEDANRPLIEQRSATELAGMPEVTAIFERYANYGPQLRERLNNHLAFLVDNRRKFYAACAP